MANEQYIFTLSDKVARKHVCYKNRFGITIAADLYTPIGMDAGAKHPAVVIGPPYSGVKEGPGRVRKRTGTTGLRRPCLRPQL